ncbi:uncharacterized protein N7483_008451 [Penicillium malachiteum]|uniref:uncharacterized protein n=1 Tax=Penicillium malachiteum TaxID=1324776 RepID=UPI002546B83B|nr:uncharacterized protein N7483_008451 [Penicillium malachiteum]KAJ5720517.1 hypothetical protein N7483_008451 [Penicillium malachiteum]
MAAYIEVSPMREMATPVPELVFSLANAQNKNKGIFFDSDIQWKMRKGNNKEERKGGEYFKSCHTTRMVVGQGERVRSSTRLANVDDDLALSDSLVVDLMFKAVYHSLIDEVLIWLANVGLLRRV